MHSDESSEENENQHQILKITPLGESNTQKKRRNSGNSASIREDCECDDVGHHLMDPRMSDPKYKLRMRKTNRNNSLRADENPQGMSSSPVKVVQDQQLKRISAAPSKDSIGRSLSYS